MNLADAIKNTLVIMNEQLVLAEVMDVCDQGSTTYQNAFNSYQDACGRFQEAHNMVILAEIPGPLERIPGVLVWSPHGWIRTVSGVDKEHAWVGEEPCDDWPLVTEKDGVHYNNEHYTIKYLNCTHNDKPAALLERGLENVLVKHRNIRKDDA